MQYWGYGEAENTMWPILIGAIAGGVFGLLFGTLMARAQIEEEMPYANNTRGN